MPMREMRLAKISMVYYTISGLTEAGYDDIDVIADFPDAPDQLEDPIVAVGEMSTIGVPFELGNKDHKQTSFIIEAYLTGDGYRDDVADALFEHINESSAPIKDYNQGFPPPKGTDAEPPQIGTLTFQQVSMFPVRYDFGGKTIANHVMRIYVNADLVVS